MGMYTELIFGASLEENTPNLVVESLKYMMGKAEKPDNFPFPEGRLEWLFDCGSYYFGVNKGVSDIWFDDISRRWHVSTRSNIKNYENEIETFLEWIEPFVKYGSGDRDMYAIVMNEEALEPRIYYLREE